MAPVQPLLVVIADLESRRALQGSLVRSRYSAADIPSRRLHAAQAEARLALLRPRVQVLELEGALFFGNVENLQQAAAAATKQACTHLVLDLRRISTIDASGAVGLARLRASLAEQGQQLLLAGVTLDNRHGQALRAQGVLSTEHPSAAWPLFADADLATESAENALLQADRAAAAGDHGFTAEGDERPLSHCALLAGLDAAACARLTADLQVHHLARGERLFAEGDPGDALYVLTRGSVSMVDGVSGQRFVSFSVGMSFGETAVLDGGGRTASAVADAPSTVFALNVAAMETLRREEPALAAQLYRNLAQHLSERLRSAAAAWRRAAG